MNGLTWCGTQAQTSHSDDKSIAHATLHKDYSGRQQQLKKRKWKERKEKEKETSVNSLLNSSCGPREERGSPRPVLRLHIIVVFAPHDPSETRIPLSVLVWNNANICLRLMAKKTRQHPLQGNWLAWTPSVNFMLEDTMSTLQNCCQLGPDFRMASKVRAGL